MRKDGPVHLDVIKMEISGMKKTLKNSKAIINIEKFWKANDRERNSEEIKIKGFISGNILKKQMNYKW